MTRSALENFGRSLTKEDEVAVEATGNAMAVVRVLTPCVARVIVANPTQVKAIAYARVPSRMWWKAGWRSLRLVQRVMTGVRAPAETTCLDGPHSARSF
jgi:hypothetical protein